MSWLFKTVQNARLGAEALLYSHTSGMQIGNIFDGNLAFATMVSNALLNTDTTPASFWVTHPNNTFTNNRAAGPFPCPPPLPSSFPSRLLRASLARTSILCRLRLALPAPAC